MTEELHGVPAPDPFVREHVTAPENRLNLALLALLNVAMFRAWFLERLKLPPMSVVYPPQNWKGVRPDFVAVRPDGAVQGWIEVELGPPDHAQLKTFRERLTEPVVCIAGTDGGDVRLAEIATEVRRIRPMLDRQQTVSARMLLKLVEVTARKPVSTSYADPDDNLRREPLITALAEWLGDRLIFGTPPVPPGKVLLTTITQKGWTLRLYSPLSQIDSSFSVIWNQAVGRGVLRVPSQASLNRYLPKNGGEVVFVHFLDRTLGVDVSQLPMRGSASVSEEELLEHVDELAAVLTVMSLHA